MNASAYTAFVLVCLAGVAYVLASLVAAIAPLSGAM